MEQRKIREIRNNISDEFIEEMLERIKEHCELDDIFSEEKIKGYVRENYSPLDLFSREEIEESMESDG